MTDDEQFDEADFDDPAHAGIRDLLASARVDTPIPAEVAARLDATLAELTRGAASPSEAPTTVVPLRRRSKVGPRLLAAAAVIVVAGAGVVGLNQVVSTTSSDDAMSGTAADSATAQRDSGGRNAPESAPHAPTAPSPVDGLLGDLSSGSVAEKSAVAARVPVLTSARFADQAAGLKLTRLIVLSRSSLDAAATGSTAAKPTPTDTNLSGDETRTNQFNARPSPADRDLASALKARVCTPPKLAGTTSYPIVLDGQPAVLVLHKPDGKTRLVEAWSCAGTRLLAIAAIPA
jgi:hypothetical protein